jgi:hypothetical protein
MATPPTQCPCGLSYEVASRLCQNTRAICKAADADGNACGQRVAVHPREAQLTSPQAQGQ